MRVEEGSNPKITAAEIIPLEDAKSLCRVHCASEFPVDGCSETTVDDLYVLFTERRGEARVLFDVERAGDFMVVMEAEGYNVQPDRNFISRVEELWPGAAVFASSTGDRWRMKVPRVRKASSEKPSPPPPMPRRWRAGGVGSRIPAFHGGDALVLEEWGRSKNGSSTES